MVRTDVMRWCRGVVMRVGEGVWGGGVVTVGRRAGSFVDIT